MWAILGKLALRAAMSIGADKALGSLIGQKSGAPKTPASQGAKPAPSRFQMVINAARSAFAESPKAAKRSLAASGAKPKAVPVQQTRAERLMDIQSKMEPGRYAAMTAGKTPEQVSGVNDSLLEQQRVMDAKIIEEEQAAKSLEDFSDTIKKTGKALALWPALGLLIPKAFRRLSEHILGAAEDFKHLDANLAGAFARLEIQKLKLDMRTANAISGSTMALASAVEDMNEQFQPLREVSHNLKNLLGTGLAVAASAAFRLSGWELAIKGLRDALEKYIGTEKDDRWPTRHLVNNLVRGIDATTGQPRKNRLPPPPGPGGGGMP